MAKESQRKASFRDLSAEPLAKQAFSSDQLSQSKEMCWKKHFIDKMLKLPSL